MREPKKRKRGSKIGFIIDPFRRRKIWYESGLEENLLSVLVAMPTVAEVREQQLVRFVRQGRDRKHFFDFIVRWTDGSVTAFAAKYSQDIDRELLLDLCAIRDSLGDVVADEYSTLSETDFDQITIENSKLIIASARDFDFEGQRAVRMLLHSVGREVRLGEIASATGLGERGYRAALSLVQSGDLVCAANKPLEPSALVFNALHGCEAR
ncbi:hypothetical protein [Candidatus Phyllobacterium onerii]|uniref:hypothetical protein n=1 Tax=Candidatus Phyllobacterium onerii TaxID=3020828 RepID=UPI00232BA764|nr:hypothetical protein [Phyllobacterium sp. IY22]